jgi:acetyl esterase/lipase
MSWVIKFAFHVVTELGYSQSLNLKAGKLGDKWVVIDPIKSPDDEYYGPFRDNNVKPERIGGTWYPDAPFTASDGDSLVVLSFHSGSFLWITGRPYDSGVTADLLNRKLGSKTHSLWIQYRLAGGRAPTPYPGAMQDAITAYSYLVNDLKISPRRIVLAGDSSGATTAMALLRYLALINQDNDHVVQTHLRASTPPRACLLFSPSVEYTVEGDAHAMDEHRNASTDLCEGRMTAWGTCAFAPPDKVRLDDPYLSPKLHPFATPVPIFVQAGGAEVAIDSIRGFAEAMRQVSGNEVEYLEVPNVPHDIYGGGHVAGWKREQEDVVDAAAVFVRNNDPTIA